MNFIVSASLNGRFFITDIDSFCTANLLNFDPILEQTSKVLITPITPNISLIIDLLLVNTVVNASPEVHAAIASLKDIATEAWGIIDAGIEKHTATTKNEVLNY